MNLDPDLAATSGPTARRRPWPPPLLAAVALTLAACGADNSGAAAPTTDATTTTAGQTAATTGNGGDTTTTTTTITIATSSTTVAVTARPDSAKVDCRPVSFPSAGRDLPGERCDPPSSIEHGPRPAAVIVGGCGGYDGDLTLKRALATALAGDGVTALIVDYHAAAPAPPETYCQPSPETLAAVPAMVSAITDAAAWLRADPTVDGTAIGAVGYSLGGLFATYAHVGDVDLASVPPASFRAIAMFASPMLPDAFTAAGAGRLPPLYLLHGELDEIVPVDDSTQLAQAAQAGGTEATLVVVPAMDHGWSEPYAWAQRADGIVDVTEFMTTQLARAD